MSTIWTVMEECLSDVAKTDELVRSSAARREPRFDADTALATFVLWERTERGARRSIRIAAARPAFATVKVPLER